MNYDAINFKNKDVDKFATKFGNGDPEKTSGVPLKTHSGTGRGGSIDRGEYQGKPEAKATGAAGRALNMTTAQAKAFDANKKKMASEYSKNNLIKGRMRELKDEYNKADKALKDFQKKNEKAFEVRLPGIN